MVVGLLPLVAALALLVVVAAAPFSRRVDRLLSRVALTAFGSFARRREGANRAQQLRLYGAHQPTTYRLYAARTYLFAVVAAVVGSLLGVYLVWGALALLGVPPETVRAALPEPLTGLAGLFGAPELTLLQAFGLLLASNATLGVAAGVTTYQLRWWLPGYRADARGRRIDESMERTVAFLYALSRSGTTFTDVLRALARNRGVYGAAADEMAVAVRDVDHLGSDALGALERIARRSPSEEFEEFAENLVSVLRSGQELPAFLEGQYDYYKEESRAKQRQFLDLLATLAEAYVTVLVAGPLFLITILVIVGLVMGGTLPFLRTFAYLLLPLATVGFVVYVDSLTEEVQSGDDRAATDGPVALDDLRTAAAGDGADGRFPGGRTDGGHVGEGHPASGQGGAGQAGAGHDASHHNVARLRAYRRFRGLRRRLRSPVRSLVERPVTLLYVTAPLATLYVLWRCWSLAAAGRLSVAAADDPVVHATLFLVGTFAVVAEVSRYRVRRIEAAVPDFLDRLASVNEAGASIVESVERVARSDLGALDEELDRIRRDVAWGGRVEDALRRFERRVETPAITRAVTLVTNALHASGDVGPVLRIAADQAQAARRLRRERRQELFTYLVVVYLSFFVFLAIIVALNVAFLPSVPTVDQLGTDVAGAVGNINLTEADKAAFEQVFVHTALVQAVCSGFVAGLLGEGELSAGAKHVTVMLAIAYAVMLFVG